MAWFWQRKQQEKEQQAARQEAVSAKRGLFTSRREAAEDKSGKTGKAGDKPSTSTVAAKTRKGKRPARAGSQTAKPAQTFGILLGPVITEKAARLAEEGTFVFAISPRANKIQVAQAVASLYNVHPVHVTVVNGPRKPKMFGQRAGRRSSVRKAYVTLASGEHIEFFEPEKTAS